ncbi:hypothetical protein EX30DRAFT_368418 [Ascodesmis nigricans]|uniref:Uncharacterized protein n=1 Tax=Ascodesmis nigricans TaxID=341454 RepID=A0A4V3SJT8_9PEZI|nr:hypothetical protein EX30DRAFT_368418 [Ascodesmis nigricans]
MAPALKPRIITRGWEKRSGADGILALLESSSSSKATSTSTPTPITIPSTSTIATIIPAIAIDELPPLTTTLPPTSATENTSPPSHHIPLLPSTPVPTLLLYILTFTLLLLLLITAIIRTVEYFDSPHPSSSTTSSHARRHRSDALGGDNTGMRRAARKRVGFNEWCRQRRVMFQRRARMGPVVKRGEEEGLVVAGGGRNLSSGGGYDTFPNSGGDTMCTGGESVGTQMPTSSKPRSPPTRPPRTRQRIRHGLWSPRHHLQDPSTDSSSADDDTPRKPTTRQRILNNMRRPILRTRTTENVGKTVAARQREMRRSWSAPVPIQGRVGKVGGGGGRGRGRGRRPLSVVFEEGSVGE